MWLLFNILLIAFGGFSAMNKKAVVNGNVTPGIQQTEVGGGPNDGGGGAIPAL